VRFWVAGGFAGTATPRRTHHKGGFMNKSILFSVSLTFILIGFTGFDLLLGDLQSNGMERAYSRVYLVAVDQNDEGMLIPLDIEIRRGAGKILMNIDNPSFITDTQQSMRTAVKEAFRLSGKDQSKFDVIFSLNTNASLVAGPSAGAAMTIGTMAALNGMDLRNDVVITGGIAYGGRITAVGGIRAKAEAVARAGKKLFLVPLGESVDREPVQKCVEKVEKNFKEKKCVVSYRVVDIEKLVGIDVVEVGTVQEALRYMVGS